MVVAGRRRSVALFVALGAAVITIVLILYIGWVLLAWRTGLLLVLGVLLLIVVICGVVLNTIFLVREIQRNEQHNAFINAVTHELKTPVASIRLYLETLQSRDVPEETRKEFYGTMLADSERLLTTIEQVLRTGRIGIAGRSLNISQIDINRLVEGCVNRARTLNGVDEQALAYRPGPSISAPGDVEELTAAVANLIDNAVKYSGREIKVTVETEPVDGKYVAVRVKDRGPGIPQSELKRIFRRFYRVPGALASRVKGTGLGLFIVRSVAKRHGGKAFAHSDGPGRGSTFVLQIPIQK
jgi:signal transduction histidine kinase